MHPMLNIAIRAARTAGDSIVREMDRTRDISIETKGKNDFVTEVDKNAEGIIISVIKNAYPEHAFLAEESGQEGENDYLWIIDPLDGTTNFLHGLPHFAISIALERDGKPFAGVVYSPVMDELFWAENGQGAFLNNERLRTSGRRNLEECLIATGMPYKGRDNHPQYPQMLDTVWSTTSGIRRFGAAALDLAYIAAGRYDGFFEFSLSPWDIAGGIIIVREAGGNVTVINGSGEMKKTGNILASNGHIHRELSEVLTKV